MRNLFYIVITMLFFVSCKQTTSETRVVEDLNNDWKFSLIDDNEASKKDYNDADWKQLNVPHDWSMELGYTQENSAASTGFVPGGIGWYRKTFKLSLEDKDRSISILFDGVYNNSKVWINGHLLGERPNGYSSFAYDLLDYLNFEGKDNVLAVKVDRTAYVDSRWYTGSGIYRKVQLIKTAPLHIAQRGIQITTPKISYICTLKLHLNSEIK